MTMRLNTLKPAAGSKANRKRVGRGRGSGTGGTAGRGTKGQKSRSGGYHKVGFEGGQMPLQRRLPKRGFRSLVNKHTAEVRLHELAKVEGDVVDLQTLQKAGVIGLHITRAKAILSGEITRAVTLRGVGATKGARAAIEKAGGTVEGADAATPKQAKRLAKKPVNEAVKETAKETVKEINETAKAPAKQSAKKAAKKAASKSKGENNDSAAPEKPQAKKKTQTKVRAKPQKQPEDSKD